MLPSSWDELFDGERDRPQTFLNNLYLPGLCAVFGFGAACFINFGTRRPIFSGIQKHLILTGIGAIFGKTADGWRNEYFAERDAVIRHYIQLHPDDFPLPERKKFADLLEEWVPVR